MAILGELLKKGIRIREMLEQEYSSPFELQKKELKELLIAGSQTEFGKHFPFSAVLRAFRDSPRDFYREFKACIPIHTYDAMFNTWWRRCLEGESNVCWPGRVKYFALSSGTSEA